jgi:hypothetical protein
LLSGGSGWFVEVTSVIDDEGDRDTEQTAVISSIDRLKYFIRRAKEYGRWMHNLINAKI